METGCEVVMPQMGPSIAEGAITRWLVEIGDRVERDQPLFEISTDKVDAEIPSPASGVLRQIFHPAGTKVPVNTTVAWIVPDMPESQDYRQAAPSSTGSEELGVGGAPQLRPGGKQAGVNPPQPVALARNRVWWSVLTVWFAAGFLWHLYSSVQGKEEAYQSLLSAAALLFSMAQLLGDSKKGIIYKLLLLASVALALSFVISLAVVHL